MRILFLGYLDSPLTAYLQSQGHTVTVSAERLMAAWVAKEKFDFLVSYGYRFLIKADVLALFPNRAINLHIAYLPWNRGADPNLWSFVENTPKGVTLHFIDEGMDTGEIIAQRKVEFSEPETLATSYQRLQQEMQRLFIETWPTIATGNCQSTPQPAGGSSHLAKDKARLQHLLTAGWDTPVANLKR